MSRDVRRHAVSIYRCASVPQYMETSNMDVEECKGLANAWPIVVGKTLRRRRRLLLPAPILKGSIMCFLRQTTPGPSTSPKDTTAQLTDKPAQASATKTPQQSPSISQARTDAHYLTLRWRSVAATVALPWSSVGLATGYRGNPGGSTARATAFYCT